jgi:hypothetical protein
MRSSFVGLVSRFGLESLLPESAISCRWLQVAAPALNASCIWAVVEQDVAGEITDLLVNDDRRTALHRLNYGAEFLGSLEKLSLSGCQWLP